MKDASEIEFADEMTLEPPGRIGIIGAGPIGLECALYGRYLGYEVVVVEAGAIGQTLREHRDLPLPMLPDRCLSPLALAAIQTQSETSDPLVLPLTIGDWIDQGLQAIAETDLLDGCVFTHARVESISLAPIDQDDELGDETEDDDEHFGEIPPDFDLKIRDADGVLTTQRVEAIVICTGRLVDIAANYPEDAEYAFRIGGSYTGDAEHDLTQGRREIVKIFAILMGRAELDLYRPRRL